MTSVSKNVCAGKLDDIVNKYNNTCHSAIKIKPLDVKTNTYIDSGKEINDKDRKINPKLLILLEYQKTKIFLQKVTLQIVHKMIL